MATLAADVTRHEALPNLLSGTPRAHSIDRWVFVFMAAWFIVIVLTGFIADSLMKVRLVQAGERPPFPPLLHVHAVLMGSFLLLLFAQTWLMAIGCRTLHMRLGILGMALAVALVVVGFLLAPTMYHETWNQLQLAPADAREKLQKLVSFKENILLVQMRIGILFSVLLAIGLRARGGNAGLHKRMMILATAMALPPGIDRITWLPTTLPASPLTVDLYPVLAIALMLAWDVIRNRSVHQAYRIWLAVTVPVVVVLNLLWDTPWWHATARQMMGV